MPYYKVCQLCGANLDPGERCLCDKEAPPQGPNPAMGHATDKPTKPTHQDRFSKGRPFTHNSTTDGSPSTSERSKNHDNDYRR